MISLARLERELAEDGDKQLGEILDPLAFPHVHSDQALDLALERMGVNQIELLPVVSRADVHDLKGIVMLQDVLDAYGISRTASNFGSLAGLPARQTPREQFPRESCTALWPLQIHIELLPNTSTAETTQWLFSGDANCAL